MFVMLMSEYLEAINQVISTLPTACSTSTSTPDIEALRRFYNFVLQFTGLSVFRDDVRYILDNDMTIQLSAKEIDIVMAHGFLTPRRDTSAINLLWLCHPKIGSLSGWILSSRKFIMEMILRRHYQELPLKEVQATFRRGKFSQAVPIEGRGRGGDGGGGGCINDDEHGGGFETTGSAGGHGNKGSKENNTKEKKSFPSPLGVSFHVYDMVGCGMITKISLPSRGFLLRAKK
jgi:hypothetical protein